MDVNIDLLEAWSPCGVYINERRLFVDWIFAADHRFTEPFFDDSMIILMRDHFNLLFRHQTPIEVLGEIFEASPGIVPSGFIFHMSRCGSTLVSQMFAALSKNIVISEAPPIDKIIRSGAADEDKIVWLQWLINAFGQRRFADEEALYIKFDSWSFYDLPLIERAFPGVPWIFMYRDPIEVIVSNLRQPGLQMIPGSIEGIFPGMSLSEILQFSTEERTTRMIGSFLDAALANARNPNGQLVEYNQLPDAVTGEIAAHFGAQFGEEDIEIVNGASTRDAKSPTLQFSPDSEKKRQEASPELLALAEKFAYPQYRELEKLRMSEQEF